MSLIYVPMVGHRPHDGLEALTGLHMDTPFNDGYVFSIPGIEYKKFDTCVYKGVWGRQCGFIFIPPLALFASVEDAQHVLTLAGIKNLNVAL